MVLILVYHCHYMLCIQVVLCPRCASGGSNSSNESFNYENYTFDAGSGDSPVIPGWHPFSKL